MSASAINARTKEKADNRRTWTSNEKDKQKRGRNENTIVEKLVSKTEKSCDASPVGHFIHLFIIFIFLSVLWCGVLVCEPAYASAANDDNVMAKGKCQKYVKQNM